MQNRKNIIFIAVVAILLILLAWFVFQSPQATAPAVPNQPAQATSSVAPNGGVQTVSNSVGSAKTGTASANPPVSSSAGQTTSVAGSIGVDSVLAPVAGDQWIIGQTNVVQWKRATGVAGSVYLVTAADPSNPSWQAGVTAGWLIQQTNSGDTSFSWNTRDLYVSHTSAIKKDVSPGQYVIKINFTSPEWPTISSAPFSIVASSQAQVPVDAFTIKNGLFSPSSLAVKEGTKLIFTDDDSVAYQIMISSFGVPFTLEPGGSYTFDTSPLSPGGTYVFYSASSSVLRASVVIQ